MKKQVYIEKKHPYDCFTNLSEDKSIPMTACGVQHSVIMADFIMPKTHQLIIVIILIFYFFGFNLHILYTTRFIYIPFILVSLL